MKIKIILILKLTFTIKIFQRVIRKIRLLNFSLKPRNDAIRIAFFVRNCRKRATYLHTLKYIIDMSEQQRTRTRTSIN